jgi:hypothetical protein
MAKAKVSAHTDTKWALEVNENMGRYDSMYYFYDGEAKVEDGYVKIPHNNTWAQRLLMDGFHWQNDIIPEDFSDVR